MLSICYLNQRVCFFSKLVIIFLGIDKAEWGDIVLDLARNVAANVSPRMKYPQSPYGNTGRGDRYDVRNYVKIKIIPGGKRNESR
jgi:hypothetical protein